MASASFAARTSAAVWPLVALSILGDDALPASEGAVVGAARDEAAEGVAGVLNSADLLSRIARAFASCSAVIGTTGAGAALVGVGGGAGGGGAGGGGAGGAGGGPGAGGGSG